MIASERERVQDLFSRKVLELTVTELRVVTLVVCSPAGHHGHQAVPVRLAGQAEAGARV